MGHDVVGTTRSRDKAGAIEVCGAQAVVADVFDADALTAAVIDGVRAEHLPGRLARDQHRQQHRYRSFAGAGLSRKRVEELMLQQAIDEIMRRLELPQKF